MFDKFEDLVIHLKESNLPETMMFTDPHFTDAFLGITSEGLLVYDYDKMIEFLFKYYDLEEILAHKYIEEHVIPSIKNVEKAPIVLHMNK